jgi:hypothetical protein
MIRQPPGGETLLKFDRERGEMGLLYAVAFGRPVLKLAFGFRRKGVFGALPGEDGATLFLVLQSLKSEGVI